MRTELVWVIRQREIVNPYTRFGSNLGFLAFEDRNDSCPIAWVTNYHYSLHNIPEERSSYLTLYLSVAKSNSCRSIKLYEIITAIY